ncbi:Hypothetical predicted protein [Octopus vulgaris]|uniref:Uncharacterized protein n=1 Tax=Octopus vulgaris TaxID=6645 RepID=A0AA36F7U9_OCTVU|nr:Hypothetical predicted protein [Octopus vulgaris]
MGAHIDDPQGRGPFCFRGHDQVYHRSSHKQFAQMYVVDRCTLEVMHRFDEIIRANNVYAESYRTPREVEVHEEQHPQQEQRPMSVVNLVFNTADRWKHNLPSANEIDIVFSNTDSKPLFNRDFKFTQETMKSMLSV